MSICTKSGEMARRAGGVECVDLNEISAEIQIPEQLDKLCTSTANKTNLQQLARNMDSSTPDFAKLDVVLSHRRRDCASSISACRRVVWNRQPVCSQKLSFSSEVSLEGFAF